MNLKLIGCLALLSITQSALANDLFQAQITIDGQSIPYKTYDNVLDMADQYTSKHLKELYPAYTNNSAVSAKITYLGLNDISLNFAENSNTAVLNIPSANIYKEFESTSRNESRKLLVKYLKSAPTNLTSALVESSYHHPVNQTRQDALDATYDTSSMITDLMATQNLSQFDSALSIVPRFGRYSQNGIDTDVITLPLGYAKWLESENYMLVIDAPITVSKSKESLAGQGSIGVGINSAVNENWHLMPQLRIGATIAPDYGVSSSLFGSSVASNYRFPLSQSTAINMINIVSFYHTGSLKFKEYKSEYDLNNFVFRNGFELSHQFNTKLFNHSMQLKAHFSRTDYTGQAVFAKYNHDMGGSIGFNQSEAKGWLKHFRVGINYSKGDNNTESLSINTGYTF